MKRRASLCAVVVVACAACGSRDAAEPPVDVPQGSVAAVGRDTIAASTVERVAAAQSLPARAALDRALSDALLAAEGRRRVHPARLLAAETHSRARLLLEGVLAEARAAGPPTDAEVAAETARRWWEVDRPELRRTMHAVVLTTDKTDDARARAFAQRVAAAVATATDAASFRELAAPLKESGLELRVEALPPVTRDGVPLEPSQLPPPGARVTPAFDLVYVTGVFKIPAVGRQSGLLKSKFGYHVILLTEIVPEHRVPLEERRQAFTEEIVLGRATRLRDAAIERAKAVDQVEVERPASELTEKVNVSR